MWDAMEELKSNWHLKSDTIELYGEEGTWSAYSHEVNDQMFLCIANDQYGSIKLLHVNNDVSKLTHEQATNIRKNLGLNASEKLTNYDVFMTMTGDENFVKGTTAFLIGQKGIKMSIDKICKIFGFRSSVGDPTANINNREMRRKRAKNKK